MHQNNPDYERQSLTQPAQRALLSAINVGAANNPFEREFVRDRNELIVLLFFHLGLRQGELLKIKITGTHFDAQKQTLSITRSPDDPTDPRKEAPQAKTNSRTLPLSEILTKRILDHIIKHRRSRRYAATHAFLFVAQSGRPLSKSAISKIFSIIRSRVEEVDPNLSPHVLRHTFNENLSAIFESSKTEPEKEKRVRSYLNGWSPQSNTAAVYLRRQTRYAAQEMGVKLSQKLASAVKRGQ